MLFAPYNGKARTEHRVKASSRPPHSLHSCGRKPERRRTTDKIVSPKNAGWRCGGVAVAPDASAINLCVHSCHPNFNKLPHSARGWGVGIRDELPAACHGNRSISENSGVLYQSVRSQTPEIMQRQVEELQYPQRADKPSSQNRTISNLQLSLSLESRARARRGNTYKLGRYGSADLSVNGAHTQALPPSNSHANRRYYRTAGDVTAEGQETRCRRRSSEALGPRRLLKDSQPSKCVPSGSNPIRLEVSLRHEPRGRYSTGQLQVLILYAELDGA